MLLKKTLHEGKTAVHFHLHCQDMDTSPTLVLAVRQTVHQVSNCYCKLCPSRATTIPNGKHPFELFSSHLQLSYHRHAQLIIHTWYLH